MSLEYELQVAILDRLKTDPNLVAAAVGVYDVIPSEGVYPYVSIDDFTALPYDSKTFHGLETVVNLSVVSNRPGQAEGKRIAAYVRAALRQPLVLREGYVVDFQGIESERSLRFEDTEVVADPVHQIVIGFRFKIKEGVN